MTKRDLYGIASLEISDLFADHLEGDPWMPFFILSSAPTPSITKNAIEKSAAALGYPEPSCLYCTLQPEIQGSSLDSSALWLLMEGIDPLQIIVTDDNAITLLEKTYRTTFSRNSSGRIFGRNAALFSDLTTLIEDDAGKRQAWELFKSLVNRSHF